MDTILKSILRRQIPFLIGGTITGTIMTYYYGFLFTIVVNSAIWYGISYLVNKYYWKNKGLNDQKYLIQYALSKINSKKRKLINISCMQDICIANLSSSSAYSVKLYRLKSDDAFQS